MIVQLHHPRQMQENFLKMNLNLVYYQMLQMLLMAMFLIMSLLQPIMSFIYQLMLITIINMQQIMMMKKLKDYIHFHPLILIVIPVTSVVM